MRLELQECGECAWCRIKHAIKVMIEEMAVREEREYREALGPDPRKGDREAAARVQRGWSEARMGLIRAHRRDLTIGCRALSVVIR